MALKHSKIKNVGVLFELLTRQITSDTISNNKKSPAISIVKEFFKKGSILSRELDLYKALQQQKYTSDSKAEKFIDIVILEYNKINRTKSKREKYNLVREIKKHYSLDDFFKSRVSNYRLNASIFSLLESANRSNNPSQIMKCRYNIIEHITGTHTSNKTNDSDVLNEFSSQSQDIRLLSYKILLEKFNSKYGKLNTKQKNLLREYINNISNSSKLKKYIIEEVDSITVVLSKLNKKVSDDIVRVKLNEVQAQLQNIKQDSIIRDKHLVSVLRSYNLIKELKNVIK
tara:strand:- start:649 stop:1506 length:858 start_codon:yes stop_codon:yes gene_type:complete